MRRSVLSLVILALITNSFSTYGARAEIAPKPGTACKGAGQNYSGGGKTYRCIKSGNKYVWDKGTTISSSGGQKLIQFGTPCTTLNMTAPAAGTSAICEKVNGKLIWSKMKDPNSGSNEQSGMGSQSGAGQSNNGTQGMKQNSDGTWNTLPGYPTDVAPPGNNGAEWFKGNWDIYTAQPVTPQCKTDKPLTNAPANVDEIKDVVGQGWMQTNAHALPVAHMYWNTFPTTDKDANGLAYHSTRVKVFAPADMTLRTVSQSNIDNGDSHYTEYGLSFSICGNYWVTWAHLDNLAPELLAAAKTGADNTCQSASQSQSGKSTDCYWSYISYRIKAGTVIGTSSGRSGGFDFAFYDTAHLNTNVMNPSTFKGRITTGKCVINYMTDSLQAQFLPKMVGNRGCGQFSYDIASSASGVWLAPGNQVLSEMEDYHIALIPYSTDSDLYRISIGGKTSVPGVPGAVYSFSGTPNGETNKLFSNVKSGEVACYENLKGWVNGAQVTVGSILIKPITGPVEKIYIAGSDQPCGHAPFSMPTNYATFERVNTYK